MKLPHKLRTPADKVNMVSGVYSTLIIGVKVSNADYVTILDKK